MLSSVTGCLTLAVPGWFGVVSSEVGGRQAGCSADAYRRYTRLAAPSHRPACITDAESHPVTRWSIR